MNPSYIEGKFVGFMKDHENIFLPFVIRNNIFYPSLDFIVDI
jgi:hypothetical protein